MRKHIRQVVVISLTAGLMALVLRNASLDRVWEAILGARWDLLAVAFLAMTSNYLVRVWRWRYLMRPIGHVRFVPALRATVMGVAATAVLPGRVGELLRPYALARSEGLSISSALATVVIERLFDVVAVLLIFGAAIVLVPPPVGAADARLLSALRLGAELAGAVALVTLGFARLAAGNPERIGRFIGGAAGWLPGRMARLEPALAHFVAGLGVMRQTSALLVTLAWSLAGWLLIATCLWLVAVAFRINLPLPGAAAVLAFTVVGVALPTPGGIGGYHAAFVGGTLLYGAPTDLAVGAALVSHAIAFVPGTVAGVVIMAREGIQFMNNGSPDVVRRVSNP
jgi:hypothetical protein